MGTHIYKDFKTCEIAVTDIKGIFKTCVDSGKFSWPEYLAICFDKSENRVFTRVIADKNNVVRFNDPNNVHFFTLSSGPISQFQVVKILFDYSHILGISDYFDFKAI